MTTAENTTISGKRKRVSKNKKKSWRKNTDVGDVEEHLEDVRLQERTGGLVAERPDEQLFFVDTVTVKEEPTDADTDSRRKRKREPKPLKCHSFLEPDQKIKPARIKHNVRQTDNPKHQSAEKRAKAEAGVVTRQQRVAKEQRQRAVQGRKEQLKVAREGPVGPSSLYDLWSDKGDNNKVETPGAEYEHYTKITKKMRVKVPNHYHQKSSEVHAVEVAHPGASYNPTYEDHQSLLHEAHEVEVERSKVEGRITKALDSKFPQLSQAPTQETWLSEMSQGLQSKDSQVKEEVDSDGEKTGEGGDSYVSNNPPVRREDKKTERQRRKEKERQDQIKAATKEKTMKTKKNSILRLKGAKKEVVAHERALAARRQRQVLRAEANKNNPKKLGKLKYEAPDIEIKLSDELEGSLRKLKPEGHLLEDRFKSLQKRNIIEPRKRAKIVRKYKLKKFDRKGRREIVE